MQQNVRIREAAKSRGVKLWMVADALGVSEGTFIRKLRHELPEKEQVNVLDIIEKLGTEVPK